MPDEAMNELLRQAEEQAAKLSNGASNPAGACSAHGCIAHGQALSLRLLCVLARREQPKLTIGGVAAGLASLGVPTPICVMIYLIGTQKGWW